MVKSTKTARLRKDKFYQLAKEAGYRSRAAFKLIQLNRKFGFLNSSKVLVDLCAAPGGWLQVASQYMPMSSVIIGVDLVPIKLIPDVITLVNDITKKDCLEEILDKLGGWKVDCVLHDGAPNVGQSWLSDAFSQSQLVFHSLKLAVEILVNNGWFVTKIFRSQDYNKLLKLFGQLFRQVIATKPIASRKESAEIFVVCKGFYGRNKIDMKILNFKSVFEADQVSEKKVTMGTLKRQMKKEKVNRDGYENESDGYNSISLTQFIEEENPLKNISTSSKILLDDSEYSLDQSLTEEMKLLFNDMRVIGLADIRSILKWRLQIRKKFDVKGLNDDNGVNEADAEEEENDDEKLDREIEEAKVNEIKYLKKKEKISKRAQKEFEASTDKNLRHNAPAIADAACYFSILDLDRKNVLNRLRNPTEEDMGLLVDEEAETEKFSVSSESDQSQDEDGEQYVDKKTLKKLRENVKHQRDLSKDLEDRSVKNLLKPETEIQEEDVDEDENFEDVEADLCFIENNLKSSLETEDKLKKKDSKDPDDDSSDGDIYDEAEKCAIEEMKKFTPEQKALAEKIMLSRKSKRDIMDACWNRYCHADTDLPEWFKVDEDRHHIKCLPITKEEVDKYRLEEREIDARPLKKVAEAKARKKMKLVRIMEKAKKRAEKVMVGEDGVADDEKVSSLRNIYKKANSLVKSKPKRTLIVAKRHLVTGKKYSRPSHVKGKYKVVDPRMKKDKRSANTSRIRKKRSKARQTKRRKH